MYKYRSIAKNSASPVSSGDALWDGIACSEGGAGQVGGKVPDFLLRTQHLKLMFDGRPLLRGAAVIKAGGRLVRAETGPENSAGRKRRSHFHHLAA